MYCVYWQLNSVPDAHSTDGFTTASLESESCSSHLFTRRFGESSETNHD